MTERRDDIQLRPKPTYAFDETSRPLIVLPPSVCATPTRPADVTSLTFGACKNCDIMFKENSFVAQLERSPPSREEPHGLIRKEMLRAQCVLQVRRKRSSGPQG